MALIEYQKLSAGLFWLEIKEIGLKLMCGCPVDAIKHVAKAGLLEATMENGFFHESGHNAILLSDQFTQKGKLCNLSEFPLLHLLYKQGLIIPPHPNFRAFKPLVIGEASQLVNQCDYFNGGNVGPVSLEDYAAYGVKEEFAKDWISIKKRFTFGEFEYAQDLFDFKALGEQPLDLGDGLAIKRKKTDLFEVSYKGETQEIDLNLATEEDYELTFELPHCAIPEAHFSIVHIGQGDGWNPDQPCLSSMVVFEGKKYILDAGPNIEYVLESFNLGPQDLEGVIMTHVHDDHFSGLYSLAIKQKGLKILAAPSVYANLIRKFSGLLGITAKEAKAFFTFVALNPRQWNEVDGLEIFPQPSPHPVDTTLFVIRAKGEAGYHTYGHFADIASIAELAKLSEPDAHGDHLPESMVLALTDLYHTPLNLKKVDIGGPPIHGDANDFAGLEKDSIVLAHTSRPINTEQQKIGRQVKFGDVDILIEKAPLL